MEIGRGGDDGWMIGRNEALKGCGKQKLILTGWRVEKNGKR